MENFDSRFDEAGLRLSDNQYIETIRAARQTPITAMPNIPHDKIQHWLLTKPPLRELPSSLLQAIVAGLWMLDVDQTAKSTDRGDILGLFRSANDDPTFAPEGFIR